MEAAPPMLLDPSQIRLAMPTPAPIRSKSRLLDVLKLLIGLLIALILAAILAVLLFVPRKSNEIDLRQSNENIAKLQRESNEFIARLQREQQIFIENERQKRQENLTQQQLLMEMQRLLRQENLTERHRLEDRSIERQRREQDLYLAAEQAKQQLEIEEKRLQLSSEERQLAEQRRKEDLNRENTDLLSKFMDEIMLSKLPIDTSLVELKAHSLIRRFDSIHKSLLISYLYKAKLLAVQDSNNPALDLQGANLSDINLDGMNAESGQVGLWFNYTQLSLPSTNLINASFEQIYLHEANFRLSNMMGASFRSSNVTRANFYRSQLSLSNFRSANLSQSNFSYAKIQRASFQYANLTQTHMDNANLGSTNFQNVIAVETKFSQSEISGADFRYADLSQAQITNVSSRSANFYSAKGVQTNFSYAYMPSSIFQWANLTNATFRNTFLTDANFENANVVNVDFTGAFLAGASITPGQLDVVLSIAQARLPDGSIGKNKNLIKNGNAACAGINETISDWTTTENVFINSDQSNNECVFQAETINATLQQRMDIRRYKRLIEGGQGKVYIEMQGNTTAFSYPTVYMNVRFFDSENSEIGQEKSTINITSSTPAPKFTTTLPCPSNTTELQITIVFKQANATVDNIYVTME